MKKYAWRQISQWESKGGPYYNEYRNVKSIVSETVGCYELVEQEDMGDGKLNLRSILKEDATDEMIKIANSVKG